MLVVCSESSGTLRKKKVPAVLLMAQTLAKTTEKTASKGAGSSKLFEKHAKLSLPLLSSLFFYFFGRKSDEALKASTHFSSRSPSSSSLLSALARRASCFVRRCTSPSCGPRARASPARVRSPSACPWRERTPSPACERLSGGRQRKASLGCSGWLLPTVRSCSSSLRPFSGVASCS